MDTEALTILEAAGQSSELILTGAICFTLQGPSVLAIEILYAIFQRIERRPRGCRIGVMYLGSRKCIFTDDLARSEVCDQKCQRGAGLGHFCFVGPGAIGLFVFYPRISQDQVGSAAVQSNEVSHSAIG